jgi:hypothetical protein
MTISSSSSLLSQVLADLGKRRDPARADTGLPARRGISSGQLRLPAPSAAARSVGAAVAARTSRRRYGAGPMSPADMSAVCSDALMAGKSAWSCAGNAELEIGILALAMNVTSVQAGAYQYAADGWLHRRAALADPGELEQFVLQKEFTSAPLIVIATGALGQAVTSLGTHGYRLMLVRGGAAIQAAWLSAEQRGLVGCAFAGMLPHAMRSHFDVDGYRTVPLIALAVGPPAPPEASLPLDQHS